MDKQFTDFRGYKYLKFQAVTCSIFCMDAVLENWNLITEKELSEEVDEQLCFDVEWDESIFIGWPVVAQSSSQRFISKLNCFR